MSMLKKMAWSFTSFKKIRSLRFEHTNKTIGFVLFLTFISLLPTFFFMTLTIVNGYHIATTDLPKSVSSFSISNSQLTSSQPFTKKVNGTAFILNPSQSIERFHSPAHAIGFLKDGIYITTNSQTQTYSYELLNWHHKDKNELLNLLHEQKFSLYILVPIAMLLLYVLTSGLNFLSITCLAYLGKLIGLIAKKQLPFKQLWALSAYSTVAFTLLYTLFEAFSLSLATHSSLYWIGTFFIYLLLVTRIPIRKKVKPNKDAGTNVF
ncbi:DUF1189 domain-containing protein [Priestia megaterium]|uniref:DUF1189 domain-containing protein n=1 Tax=Priestia megaterium TaxID=1404 RepID=UPI002041FB23|nr:DUF1189 domain-containing protein [Priestia megaterium]MCM3183122.1 DUF1189 domain-containing protein [Priestia megaterium]